MKKLLILIAIISISLPTYCSSNIQSLEWSEICPYEYLNARVLSDSEIERYAIQKGAEQSNVFYCKYHGPTAKILRTITIIPALDCWGAKNLQLQIGVINSKLKILPINIGYKEKKIFIIH